MMSEAKRDSLIDRLGDIPGEIETLYAERERIWARLLSEGHCTQADLARYSGLKSRGNVSEWAKRYFSE